MTKTKADVPHAPTIEALYLVADDEQATVLEDLQVRLGWLWRCRPCRYVNVAGETTCESCGTPQGEATLARY